MHTLATSLTTAAVLGACAVPAPRTRRPRAARPCTAWKRACSGGGLRTIRVEVDAATRDTTFQGRPLNAAFPLTGSYAAEAAWYVGNEPIPEVVWPYLNARGDYVKYGRPRAVPADSLTLLGYHHGVGVYAVLDDAPENDGILYVPVRPGCWFQQYQFMGVGEMRDG